jgi:branched-chain amino acid transport system permease protein
LFWLTQILNGISFGMLLFVLATGLSQVFGVMRVLNLMHGSFYLLGGYIAISVEQASGSLALGVVSAIVAVTLLGLVLERTLIRRVIGSELKQILVTFGLFLILGQLMLAVWGGYPLRLSPPQWLTGAVDLGGMIYPTYRLFVVGVGVGVLLVLWYVQEVTLVGAKVQATVDDPELAHALGLNVPVLSHVTFGVGAALAALAGVVGAPFLGVNPHLDLQVLLYALVVVIIGGAGSLWGALVGALVIGLLDSFGKGFFPEIALFTLFAPMALILIVRPRGLFGRA